MQVCRYVHLQIKMVCKANKFFPSSSESRTESFSKCLPLVREDLVQGQVLCNLAWPPQQRRSNDAAKDWWSASPALRLPWMSCRAGKLGSHAQCTVLNVRELSCLLANTRRHACFKSWLEMSKEVQEMRCPSALHHLFGWHAQLWTKQELIKILMQNNVEQFHLCQDQILLPIRRFANQKKCEMIRNDKPADQFFLGSSLTINPVKSFS